VRTLSVVVALVSVGSATSAFAGGGEEAIAMLGFSLLEISCKASTAASASSSSSSQNYARNVECDASTDCHVDYECRSNACVRREASDLPSGHAVQNVSSKPAPTPAPAVPIYRCESESECSLSQTCSNGQCVSIPPAPSSSLRRRGSELYLRERAVELREELALGQGPVINGLANVEGVPAKKLGRALREHRAELARLMGEGPDWPARFLTRVDALCGPS
jgi:hypothetical protein